MSETWKPVVGWEGLYEVSDQGRVRSLDRTVPHVFGSERTIRGRVLTPGANEAGHRYVALCKDGVGVKTYVHRMVLEAFVGPAPEGTEGCHGPTGASDNRLENLRWDTHSENLLDVGRNGEHHMANKTHCLRGHPFSEENTLRTSRGYRVCRTCKRARAKSARAGRAAA